MRIKETIGIVAVTIGFIESVVGASEHLEIDISKGLLKAKEEDKTDDKIRGFHG